MQDLIQKILFQPLWTQGLICLLLILVSGFLLYILAQVVMLTIALLRPGVPIPRQTGILEAAGGGGLLVFSIGAILAQEWLNTRIGTAALVAPIGAIAAGLYFLANGLGILFLRRAGAGVVLLIWGIIGGVVWLILR